jgi:hypothetical protein
MALQTIEKLKSYFYEHAYPTWQQFHDLLDSFRHKNDKVPMTDVDGLSDVLNGKAATSTVQELVHEVDGKEDAGVAASLVADEATARQQSDQALQANIDEKADSADVYTKDEVDNKLASVYKYKGSVTDEASLPTSDQDVGDVYNTEDTGMNFAWNGTGWDALGGGATGFVSYLNNQDLTIDQKLTVFTNLNMLPHRIQAIVEDGNVAAGYGLLPDSILFSTLDVFLNGVLQMEGLDYNVDHNNTTEIKVTFTSNTESDNLNTDDIVLFKFFGGTPVPVR